MLSARIELPGPVDPVRTLRRLALFTGDRTFAVDDGTVWCGFRTADGPAAVAYRRLDPCAVEARAFGPGAERALAGAPAHLGAEDRPETLRTDHPVVAPLLRRFAGLRFGRTGRILERLLPTIIAQKVTGAGAARSWKELIRACSEPAPGPREGLWLPPSVERLRELATYDYHRFGIEEKRARVLIQCVRRARTLERLAEGDSAAARARLGAIRGIGPWTIASVLNGALGDADAVSVGDYNLPHLVTHALADEPRGDDARMLELLEPFRPHRARVCALLAAGGHGPPRRGPRLPVRDIRRH